MTAELVRMARDGDHTAFERLATQLAGRLFGTASLIVRDPDAARDAVQETLIEVWRSLPTLRDTAAFDGWLRRILVRRCYRAVDDQRKRRIEVRTLDLDAPIASHESAVAATDQIERAFRRLTPEQRAVLVLHHHLGLPLTDTASALGIPLGTVKSRVNRATTALRAALAAEDRDAAHATEQMA